MKDFIDGIIILICWALIAPYYAVKALGANRGINVGKLFASMTIWCATWGGIGWWVLG